VKSKLVRIELDALDEAGEVQWFTAGCIGGGGAVGNKLGSDGNNENDEVLLGAAKSRAA
jgi:hypothetical protein